MLNKNILVFNTIAFSKPLPLTLIALSLLKRALSSDLKISPILNAFSTKPSLMITSSEASATLQANALPPYVDPCVPGVRTSITSLLPNTAEI